MKYNVKFTSQFKKDLKIAKSEQNHPGYDRFIPDIPHERKV